MESLKILMVSTYYPPNHVGGDAVMAEYLSTELARRGHEVEVFCSPRIREVVHKREPAKSRSSNDLVKVHEYAALLKRGEPALSYCLGLWGRARNRLQEISAALKPDVVHWHNTKAFIARPTRLGTERTVYTAHDYFAVCPKTHLIRHDGELCDRPRQCQLCLLRSRKYPQIWRAGSRRVFSFPENSIIICPSEFMAKRLQADGVHNTHVIRNFAPDRGIFAGDRTIPKDTLTYVGIMEKHKGPHRLLEAFAASKTQQGFNLALVGEGSLRGTLLEQRRAQGIVDRVSIPGFVEQTELDSILRRSAAVVVPSEWYENCPLVVLEAYSRSIPVVASSIGGLPEIVGDESGSILFEAGNEEMMARALTKLWDERERLGEMGIRARRAFENLYGADKYISRYLEAMNA
jgi:glycosyltransferase involved in cell wall biosynthesis